MYNQLRIHLILADPPGIPGLPRILPIIQGSRDSKVNFWPGYLVNLSTRHNY